jgi:hypothetical protein
MLRALRTPSQREGAGGGLSSRPASPTPPSPHPSPSHTLPPRTASASESATPTFQSHGPAPTCPTTHFVPPTDHTTSCAQAEAAHPPSAINRNTHPP